MLCADDDDSGARWRMPFRLRLESARSKLLGSRRSSTASVAASDAASSAAVGAGSEKARSIVSQPSPLSSPLPQPPRTRSSGTHSIRTPPPLSALSKESLPSPLEPEKPSQLRADQHQSRDRPSETIADRSESLTSKDLRQQAQQPPAPPPLPTLELEEPSPVPDEPPKQLGLELPTALSVPDLRDESDEALHPLPTPEALSPRQQRPLAVRRQSLVHNSNARVIKTLLDSQRTRPSTANSLQEDYFSINAGMLHRKIWVKRPGASPTLVQIREDDLVDDVRDMILKKYANSLGRSYDSPDMVLRIVSRDPAARPLERTLGPEEEMCRTLDEYYPGGQTVDEALVIDVPQRRTPKPSPRGPLPPHVAQFYGESRPAETDADYFPPMPALGAPSPASLTSLSHDSRQSHSHQDVRSIAVLTTGHVPPLPSPGATRQRPLHRPRPHRNLTSSPTQGSHPVSSTSTSQHLSRPNRGRLDSGASETKHPAAPAAPPLPTPPAPEVAPPPQKTSTPPTPRIQSPDPRKPKRKKNKETGETPSLPSGLLDGSVPPINVLIVEDNIINLKLLEAFMKRLKVRWQTAMNGRDAVVKWRAGGFHLVLMDIQLPIMSGLEATKEIRRLERVNNIGVFSNSSASSTAPILPREKPESNGEPQENDKLGDGIIFKSPVIIVALTASSLQSDRHEALAAGCNDFLTKPVNFVWLERKVKEWGCMQALIDYDGWRKWKTFTSELPAESKDKPKTGKKKTNRASMSKAPGALAAAVITSPEQQALSQAVQAPATDAVVDGAVEIEAIPPAPDMNNTS
ncbi:osomolarity two-component response regulator ssk1 [Diplodia corticola]|uniref:Osomolarity two-component response regulator ssk1 n=1 Tax=Diplodia corticola TaxID=236234 RepID=A0A1J9QSB0_9PEZI|nr:osomolarity two-component response regulator ssk1 [Diplodia corticola]OJD31336.1 osomolarity two-component response regulator ssk1 [Diplodia corticola]